MSKVAKPFDRRIQDFLDYHWCLGEDIKSYEQGNHARLKTILCVLRVLVCDNNRVRESGLTFTIDENWKIGSAIIFHGMDGVPETNPLSKDRTVSLLDYLEKIDEGFIPGEGRPISNKDFIWKYASSDGAHSDPDSNYHFAFSEEVMINGRRAIDLQTLTIAKNIFVSIEAMIRVAIKDGRVQEE